MYYILVTDSLRPIHKKSWVLP